MLYKRYFVIEIEGNIQFEHEIKLSFISRYMRRQKKSYCHRDGDLPSYYGGDSKYYAMVYEKHGKLHRLCKPAIVDESVTDKYYEYGKHVGKFDYSLFRYK